MTTSILNTQREFSRDFAELRREFDKEIALLERENDDLKKWKDEQKKDRDERSRRLWSFGPNILGALVSGVIAAIVAWFIAHR